VSEAGRCAAQDQKEAASPPLTFDKKAAAPGLGDAPRQGTGPPLSVKAGCDRRATANRQAARRMYTRSLALSAEPPATPRGPGKAGRPRPAPRPARGASDDHRTRVPAGARSIKVNWRSIVRRRTEITRIH